MSFFARLFGRPKGLKTEEDLSSERNPEDEFQKAVIILENFKRKAYLPVVSEQKSQFSEKTKIGGYPYLRHSADWPICPNCQKNLQLFLQLNMADLPEKKESGLIQLFYCTSSNPHCESDLEAFFPFSKAVECRRIRVNGPSAETKPTLDELFQERRIVNWKVKDDYPHQEEYEKLGISLELEDDVYELMEERKIGIPLEGDKLFGWPYWVQSVEYPSDRITLSQMELLFQFDSEINLPYMFGDSGIGHLTQSPDNLNELAFGWACH